MTGGRRGAAPDSYLLDPLLLPRIEQYAHNNNIANIDNTVDYLRRSYREYQRKQILPFRKMVLKAVRIARQRMRDEAEEDAAGASADMEPRRASRHRVDRVENRLLSREEEHLRRRRPVQSADGSEVTGSDSSGESEEEEESGSVAKVIKTSKGKIVGRVFSESEEDSELDKSRPSYNLLNSSLMATYNTRPALVIQSPTFNGTSVFGNLEVKMQKTEEHVQGENSGQAFASPEVVAAAARASLGKKSPKNSSYANGSKDGVVDDVKAYSGNPAESGGRLRKEASNAIREANGKESTRKRERDKESEMAGNRIQAQAGKKSRMLPGKKEGKDSAEKTSKNLTFKDFGGLGTVIDDIADFIYPVLYPPVYDALGIEPMRGMLLHGPPGCGKTMLAEAIANEANVPFLKISSPEVVSGTSGESEAKLRSLFSEATRVAPSIIFIDEIDAISSKRESAQREMERRIVTQLMICMDELGQASRTTEDDVNNDDKRPSCVLVIGATNRPDSLDQALRRRFDREICLEIPDEQARLQILIVLTSKLRLEGAFDFKHIARRTPGFVGADLKALTKEAGSIAIRRIVRSRPSTSKHEDALGSEPNAAASRSDQEGDSPWWKLPWTSEELQAVSITMHDFEDAIKKVQPSTKREGFTEIPNVTFEDVGSLDSVRDELDLFICRRVKHPEDYEALGFTDSGFLLYGPPGCGKTLVAKAVANAAGANFIYVKAGELFNKYVGESERAVRQLFSRARACSPCLIFFDEVDALAPSRGNEANAATDRVVNQLLVEMDGLDQRKGVFLIAATNRANMIDPALLRPGRLGKLIYVPLPDAQGRASILKTLLRRTPLASDVDSASIAESDLCNGFTGADLHGLVQEACAAALRDRVALWQENNGQQPAESIVLTHKHFLEALNRVRPSVSAKDHENFSLDRRVEKRRTFRAVASCPQPH